MLIAQCFPIVSVYYLRGGQYAYRGNVISFPQDVGDDRLDHDTEDTIVRNFIPAPLPSHGEDRAIDDALGRMQSNNHPVMWPNLGINAINEFNTPGYIARAFPVLYPTGSADLRA